MTWAVDDNEIAEVREQMEGFRQAALAEGDGVIGDMLHALGICLAYIDQQSTLGGLTPTVENINRIVGSAFGREGIERWWNRPRTTLKGLTPKQAFPTNPEVVYRLAKDLLGPMGAT